MQTLLFSVPFDDVLSVKENYMVKSDINGAGGYARAWILGIIGGMQCNNLLQGALKQVFIFILIL